MERCRRTRQPMSWSSSFIQQAPTFASVNTHLMIGNPRSVRMTAFNSPTAKLTTGSLHSAEEHDHVSGSRGTETTLLVEPTTSLVVHD